MIRIQRALALATDIDRGCKGFLWCARWSHVSTGWMKKHKIPNQQLTETTFSVRYISLSFCGNNCYNKVKMKNDRRCSYDDSRSFGREKEKYI